MEEKDFNYCRAAAADAAATVVGNFIATTGPAEAAATTIQLAKQLK